MSIIALYGLDSKEYEWLYEHFEAQQEFENRFKHSHKSWNKLKFFTSKAPQNIESSGFVEPTMYLTNTKTLILSRRTKNIMTLSFRLDGEGRPMRWTTA